MLIKEYRISLPMSVEEYRIAQLYMIMKKSRDESHGTESGVEIIENKPYTDGPGGNGQYTYKIYHVGSHLPGWFRAILPKSALRVEEEAWNAYPYTKTRYKCPFIEKLLLEVETRYLNDAGGIDNMFNLSKAEKATRIVDYIDIVKDHVSGGDYRKEEDPKLYISQKTGRGPLAEEWRHEYGSTLRDGRTPEGGQMMTAYKLCRVEFKYWGMQNKIERFIHDVALRKTMLRAHRQAWAWQDEYYGLTLDDIRRLERETQLALAEKMAAAAEAAAGGAGGGSVDGGAKDANNGQASAVGPSTRSSSSPSPSASSSTVESGSGQRELPVDVPGVSAPPFPAGRACDSPHRGGSGGSSHQKSKSDVSVHFSDCPSEFGGQTMDISRSVSQESTASTVVNGGAAAAQSRRHSHRARSKRSGDGHWSSLEQLQEPSSDEEFFDAHG